MGDRSRSVLVSFEVIGLGGERLGSFFTTGQRPGVHIALRSFPHRLLYQGQQRLTAGEVKAVEVSGTERNGVDEVRPDDLVELVGADPCRGF